MSTESVVEGSAPGCAPFGWRRGAVLLVIASLAGCSGSRDGGESSPDVKPTALDREVLAVAQDLGLTGDPATPRGLSRKIPASDPLVKLGQLLFFSQTLAAGYDVSCGTCHHPVFGGSDGLSLSVGVVPGKSSMVGPGREVDAARDLDPSADGGPNMHRNSITTFNAALFDRSQMYDGRVFVEDGNVVPGGHGQLIRTPESGQGPDSQPLSGLMQFTMKSPIVNDNEMRGFLYTDFATPTEYRRYLARRLRGEVDTEYNTRFDAPDIWLGRFRAGFARPQASAAEVIVPLNIQRALAAYVKSQVFVDTRWREYLAGNVRAISSGAKNGALLFFKSREDGGLGCSACHAGDRLTDENFHNVAFPQFGRGLLRSDKRDLGRWLVTRSENDRQAFRTPSLLNVAMTAPYGHTGAFDTLEELVAYHANPRVAVETYDFTLASLKQFQVGGVSYPNAEAFTREALELANFSAAEALLPGRALSSKEISQLVAFLEMLTDRCVADPACIGQWAPGRAEDPDGHTLVINESQGTPGGGVNAPQPADYPRQVTLTFPAQAARGTFSDVQGCSSNINTTLNTGEGFMRRSESSFGLEDRHGYSINTWFSDYERTLEIAMIGGGVTAAYLDDDCWPDLVFTGGAVSGMRFYRNNAGTGFSQLDPLSSSSESEYTGVAVADLNGDYRRELIFGNVKPGVIPVFGANGATGRYDRVAALPMVRPTFGISFAPLDSGGHLYMFLAHWSGGTGTSGTSPALWRTDGVNAYPWDTWGRTTSANLDQNFNFTPKFADFTGDGRIDMVMASDFRTSATLRNVPDGPNGWHFENQTDRGVITDDNGMGSALLDIDNDGNLEWFVTSILDPTTAEANWGVTGNRLYRNSSTAEKIAFTDITEAAGVRDGYWGWGACAADFNNDGFIDLFHVNGFGFIPEDVVTTEATFNMSSRYAALTGEFRNKPARLFINDGDGTFSERAASWGIDAPSEGRGVTCFDYDRDGDVDITVFDHSRQLQFFENLGGAGNGHHFLGVRVVGAAPNTDAIGARVFVTADVGGGHGVQTQLRLAEANSNFNSQNLPDLYFGLGSAATATEIRVEWPGGGQLTCSNVPVNQFLVLDQRDGQGACPTP